ncbi:MAG: DUF4397 domain-containing protein [Cytophagaceae bacterium]|nr:DUF4397 domain-containing protein [Gemmatimonadaceae bacterium]
MTTQTASGEASTSISGDSADKRGEALVRVVNAVPQLNALRIRADSTHVLPVVDYKGVTPYQAIDHNWVSFQASASPDDVYEPLETNREVLSDGHRYTMVVMRDAKATGFQTRVVRDDISDDMTRAHLRVIHAAQGIDEVKVIARRGDELFSGVSFTSDAGFKDLAPWAGTLEFRAENENRLLLSMPKVDLKAGRSYTIVLTLGKKGTLEAFWFEDMQSTN